MSNKSSLVGAFVSAYDKNRLEGFCRDLTESFPRAKYVIQYMTRSVPLKMIVKKEKRENPDLELLIIGNTNKSFGTHDDFDYVIAKAKEPFRKNAIIDLRVAEETGTGKILKDTILECLEVTKDTINQDLISIKEKN